MEIMMVLSELDLPARIDHGRDIKEIAKMGIMGSPAVLVNGEIKCTGVVPTPSQLMNWLSGYKTKEEHKNDK